VGGLRTAEIPPQKKINLHYVSQFGKTGTIGRGASFAYAKKRAGAEPLAEKKRKKAFGGCLQHHKKNGGRVCLPGERAKRRQVLFGERGALITEKPT